jgi:Prokaryotic homologs of the JAB domain
MFPILAADQAADGLSLPAFLVARDGVYLRKRTLLGESQTKVDRLAHLPTASEYVEYALPPIPHDLVARVVGFFRAVYRSQRTEALVLLLWEAGRFGLHVPRQRVSASSVKFTLADDELPAGSRLVGTIHSHGAFGAFASSIDEADEASLDGLHLVIGDLDRRAPSYSAAIAIDGQRFTVGLRLVLERPRRFVEPPADWLGRVKLLLPPRSKKRKAGSTGLTSSFPALGSGPRTRASRSELDAHLEEASRMADELGYRLAYWLTPVSSPREPGGANDA